MSVQELLIEEIKRQPEPVLRELQIYLNHLKRQQAAGDSMETVVAETWEKIGPAPDVDYDQI